MKRTLEATPAFSAALSEHPLAAFDAASPSAAVLIFCMAQDTHLTCCAFVLDRGASRSIYDEVCIDERLHALVRLPLFPTASCCSLSSLRLLFLLSFPPLVLPRRQHPLGHGIGATQIPCIQTRTQALVHHYKPMNTNSNTRANATASSSPRSASSLSGSVACGSGTKRSTSATSSSLPGLTGSRLLLSARWLLG